MIERGPNGSQPLWIDDINKQQFDLTTLHKGPFCTLFRPKNSNMTLQRDRFAQKKAKVGSKSLKHCFTISTYEKGPIWLSLITKETPAYLFWPTN